MEFNLGSTIKKLRISRGITQEELAQKLNVTFQAVSKWENNISAPDISLLPRLAIFFGVSMDTLFSLDNEAYLERISNMIRDEHTIDSNQFRWAEEFLIHQLEDESSNQKARTLLIELYGHRENRDQLNSIRLCKEGLMQNSDQTVLHQKLIRLGKKRDDIEMLLTFYSELYQKNPCSDLVAEQLAALYAMQKNQKEALKLISLYPTIKNQLLEGDILFSTGKQLQAISLWEQIASNNATDSAILFSVAECLEQHGEEILAEQYYRSSYNQTSSPKPLDSLYALAFMYTRQIRYKDAIDVWNQIISDLKQEYGITKGECFDWAKREIAKLNTLCTNG